MLHAPPRAPTNLLVLIVFVEKCILSVNSRPQFRLLCKFWAWKMRRKAESKLRGKAHKRVLWLHERQCPLPPPRTASIRLVALHIWYAHNLLKTLLWLHEINVVCLINCKYYMSHIETGWGVDTDWPLVITLRQNPEYTGIISTLVNLLQKPPSSEYQMTNKINPSSAAVMLPVPRVHIFLK